MWFQRERERERNVCRWHEGEDRGTRGVFMGAFRGSRTSLQGRVAKSLLGWLLW